MSDNDNLIRWGLHLLEVPTNPTNSTEHDEEIAISLQQQLYLDESAKLSSPNDPVIGGYFENCTSSSEICEECAAEEHHEEEEQREQHQEEEQHHKEEKEECFCSEEMMGNSSSSKCIYEQQNENDEAIAVILSEELAQHDGEVGRRLTHMESIPHVPKINGEIPSADAATLDHQRLLERLQVYGLTEHRISGDGNCQFRALSDQFYRTPDHHMFVRKEIIKQLKHDPEPYEGYVPMRFSDYLKRMSKNGEWGDHVTLQAAADAYGMKICLITSFRDTCIIDIVPKQPKSERVIFLSFWAEVHYNSVYPEGEVPVSYHFKKKRHWFSLFG